LQDEIRRIQNKNLTIRNSDIKLQEETSDQV